MPSFGERLRGLRHERDITQEQLAAEFGLHKTRISQYELDKRQADDDMKIKFANYFNVSVDYLIGKSDIREAAEKILERHNDSEYTIALHDNRGYDEELPEEARKEINDFIEFVKHKYGKKE